jgi:hypothetical protein
VPTPLNLINYQAKKGKLVRNVYAMGQLKNTPEQIRKYGANNVKPITIPPTYTEEGIGIIDGRLNNYCPFLKTNARCNIYKDRPFICKDFGSRGDCPDQITLLQFPKAFAKHFCNVYAWLFKKLFRI